MIIIFSNFEKVGNDYVPATRFVVPSHQVRPITEDNRHAVIFCHEAMAIGTIDAETGRMTVFDGCQAPRSVEVVLRFGHDTRALADPIKSAQRPRAKPWRDGLYQ